MIIRDTNDEPLSLTSTRLAEQTKGDWDTQLFAAYLTDIKDGQDLRLHDAKQPDVEELQGRTRHLNNFAERSIGCRTFDEKTFKRIMDAVRKARAKKK